MNAAVHGERKLGDTVHGCIVYENTDIENRNGGKVANALTTMNFTKKICVALVSVIVIIRILGEVYVWYFVKTDFVSDPLRLSDIYHLEVQEDTNKAEDLTFLVIGDWGAVGPLQEQVAQGMAIWCTRYDCDLVLSTGDNFYPDGLRAKRKAQVTRWKQLYSSPGLINVPWYVTLGNHDHRNDLRSSVGYEQVKLSRTLHRWHLPAFSYSFVKTFLNQTVHFISIDTFLFMQTGESYRGEMARALKKELSMGQHDWTIIFAHDIVFASSEMRQINREMNRIIVPILRKYNVDFYICGHDHALEHLTQTGTPTDFIISGTGSKKPYAKFSLDPIPVLQNHKVKVNAFLRSNGFVSVSIKQDYALVDYVNTNGKIIYSFAHHKIKK